MKNKLDSLFYHKFISEPDVCFLTEQIAIYGRRKIVCANYFRLFEMQMFRNENYNERNINK